MSSEADALFHQLCERFQDADKKDKWRCCFCKRKRAYNLTKFKKHLCGSGRSACPMMYKPLKPHTILIYDLQTAIRSRQDKQAELFEAVGEANKLLAIILKNDNNPFGIPLGGLNDADLHTDEDPLADEDTGGVMPVPMAEGTRGEQIVTTAGPIVVAEIGESSKGRANTLPEVDVSSPLNPSQETDEKDPISLNPVTIEAKSKFAALEEENADLEPENANFNMLNWENADFNMLNWENAELNMPDLEIADFNMLDWENEEFSMPNLDDL